LDGWIEVCAKPRLRAKSLRDFEGLLSRPEGPNVISEQLGHASVAFTLDVYSHVLPHMQDAAAEKVEALLKAGGK
jgi:integrase